MKRYEAEFSNLVKAYRKHPPVEMERLLGAKFVGLYLDIDVVKEFGMSTSCSTRICSANSVRQPNKDRFHTTGLEPGSAPAGTNRPTSILP